MVLFNIPYIVLMETLLSLVHDVHQWFNAKR